MKVTDKISSILYNTNLNARALLQLNQINNQSFHFIYGIRNKDYHIALLALRIHIIKKLQF